MDEYSFNTTISPPETYTKANIIYWNEDWKKLEGVTEATAIKTKAKKWLFNDCIEFSEKHNCYVCKAIKGYNKTLHKMKLENGQWNCSCQFHNKVIKEGLTNLTCSHVLALKLHLDIVRKNG
jgi:hypothetical protein